MEGTWGRALPVPEDESADTCASLRRRPVLSYATQYSHLAAASYTSTTPLEAPPAHPSRRGNDMNVTSVARTTTPSSSAVATVSSAHPPPPGAAASRVLVTRVVPATRVRAGQLTGLLAPRGIHASRPSHNPRSSGGGDRGWHRGGAGLAPADTSAALVTYARVDQADARASSTARQPAPQAREGEMAGGWDNQRRVIFRPAAPS